MRLLAFAALLALLAGPASAEVLYVDTDATGADTGTGWIDAFTDLQDALAVAGRGDEIWVAEGTYTPTSGTDELASFDLVDGVKLYGGFAGDEPAEYFRDWLGNATVLSGALEPGPFPTRSLNVVNADTVDSTTFLDGFRIRGGQHGLRVSYGNPLIRQCVIEQNQTSTGVGAGAILTGGTRVVFSDVTIRDNHSIEHGGGVASFSSQPTFERCTFDSNTAALTGGGMFGDGTFVDTRFQYNHADWTGGALNGGGTLQRVTFHANSSLMGTAGMDGRGELTDVLFVLNQGDTVGACHWGGGALRGGGTLTNVLFAGNSHTCRGGAMSDPEGGSILRNVIFVDNESLVFGGGALWIGPSPLVPSPVPTEPVTLVQTTFAGNRSGDGTDGGKYDGGFGGGALMVNDTEVSVGNSVLWDNQAEQSPTLRLHDATVLVRHSLLQGSGGSGAWIPDFGTDQGGNLDADPLFVEPFTAEVVAGSPTIDAGDDALVPADLTTDFSGEERIQGPHVDMGAEEFTPEVSITPPPTVPVPGRYLTNVPNPFNPSTTIQYGLSGTGPVEIALYDLRGRHVRTLLRATRPAGDHELPWDGRDATGRRVASGVYLCRMQGDGFVLTRRLVLLQ